MLTRDGHITRDEVIATVKSMMNIPIGSPLDAEGEELLSQISADLRRKYGYAGENGGAPLTIDNARAAWAKYKRAASQDEL